MSENLCFLLQIANLYIILYYSSFLLFITHYETKWDIFIQGLSQILLFNALPCSFIHFCIFFLLFLTLSFVHYHFIKKHYSLKLLITSCYSFDTPDYSLLPLLLFRVCQSIHNETLSRP